MYMNVYGDTFGWYTCNLESNGAGLVSSSIGSINSDKENVKIIQRIWNTNIVPFAIDADAKHMREEFKQALNVWSKICQLRFYETENL